MYRTATGERERTPTMDRREKERTID